MPGGDGTGPAGFGPMTGRGAGYCAGYPVPGFMNPIPGRGSWGWGGGGRGRRNWFYATGMPGWTRAAAGYPAWGMGPQAMPAGGFASPMANPMANPWIQPSRQQQIDALKGQAEYFEDMLDGIKSRIEEFERETAEPASEA